MRKKCPCQSSRYYAECCGLYHRGEKQPTTAEVLMRSRYSAYVPRDSGYLFKSWHSQTRPARKTLKKLSPREWLGLRILRTEAGRENDDTGMVEFVATHLHDGQVKQLHEVSRFSREEGNWRYTSRAQEYPIYSTYLLADSIVVKPYNSWLGNCSCITLLQYIHVFILLHLYALLSTKTYAL